MKTIRSAILLFSLLCAALTGADLSLKVNPEKPVAGTSATLILNLKDGRFLHQAPPSVKDIAWTGISTRTSDINGEVEQTMLLKFTPAQAGTYTIPSFPIAEIKGKAVRTEPLTFEVLAPPDYKEFFAEGKMPEEPVFARFLFPEGEKKTCWIGERIPVHFLIFLKRGTRIRLHPHAGVVFQRQTGSAELQIAAQEQDIDEAGESAADVNGTHYDVLEYRTDVFPISGGELKLRGQWGPFFTNSGNRAYRTADAVLSGVKVQPLPVPESGMPPFCGLVGEWKIKPELSGGAFRVGEPATLRIRIAGTGSAKVFLPPEPEMPDFRIYPPEVRQEGESRCSAVYTLIPLKEGEQTIRLAFSTFDPAKEDYVPFVFEHVVKIEPKKGLIHAQDAGTRTFLDASGQPPSDPERTENGSGTPREDILYLHRDLSKTVDLPLWRNALRLGSLLFAAGFLFLIAAFFSAMRQSLYRDHPELLRRKEARKQKRALIRKLRNARAEDIANLLPELSDYLNDVLDLPPGSGLDNAAAEFNEAKTEPFSKILKELANVSWLPGNAKSFSEEKKNTLIRGLSRFTSIVLLAGASFLILPRQSSAAEPDTMSEQALSAYDNGDFSGALHLYASRLNPDSPSPDILYNMGNCYYQMGKLPVALVCYERAARLNPRDGDIQENRNLTRRKLLLPERGKMETPVDILIGIRDSMRLDEWLLFAVFGAVLLLIAVSIRLLRKKYWLIPFCSGLAFLACGIPAFCSQNAVLGAENRSALILDRNVPLYPLPSDKNGKPEKFLKEGQEVSVEETRLNWARIRAGSEEGWIHADAMLPLWNDTMTDLILPDAATPSAPPLPEVQRR